jgi:two-component system, NarL family, response regulator NreC
VPGARETWKAEAMITIVLADDHTVMRQGLKSLLNDQADFEVLGEASDGGEALRLVEKLRPDVLVADMAMGDMSGVELTRQVKQRVPGTAVVVLSMYGIEGYVHQAMRAGARAYVLKESSADELVTAIRQAMSGKRYLSRTLSEHAISVYLKEMVPPSDSTYTSLILTARESDILKRIARGKRNKEIATELSISPRTVEFHRANIMRKLGVRSQQQLFQYCIRTGILRDEA